MNEKDNNGKEINGNNDINSSDIEEINESNNIDNSDNSVNVGENAIQVAGGNGKNSTQNINSNEINNISNNKTITGKGNIVTKNLELKSFTEIQLSNYCDIEIIKGPTFKVVYSDYENIIDNLQFENVNNKLIVKSKSGNLSINNSKAKAKIYLASNLTSLSVSGSADATISSAFNELKELKITGSGNISCNTTIKTNDIKCIITGSGDMNLLKAIATNADCSLVGSGDISISVQSKLDASIVGSGDINYKGNPIVEKNITGSGELIKIK
jgi:hypothetical protein